MSSKRKSTKFISSKVPDDISPIKPFSASTSNVFVDGKNIDLTGNNISINKNMDLSGKINFNNINIEKANKESKN